MAIGPGMAEPKYEYRWEWKREPHGKFYLPSIKKARIYQTLRGALQFGHIFGDEPWKAKFPYASGAEPVCCRDPDCPCENISLREAHEKKDWAPLEYAKLERREVGKWERIERGGE